MPNNGIMQRFKGTVKVGRLWLGRQVLNGPGAMTAYSTAGTQTIDSAGGAVITASSALSVFTLGATPVAGHRYSFNITSVSSGVMLKAAANTSFDPSTNTVIKSTYAMTIVLMGVSTSKWCIESVFPPSTAGVANNSGITLSATT